MIAYSMYPGIIISLYQLFICNKTFSSALLYIFVCINSAKYHFARYNNSPYIEYWRRLDYLSQEILISYNYSLTYSQNPLILLPFWIFARCIRGFWHSRIIHIIHALTTLYVIWPFKHVVYISLLAFTFFIIRNRFKTNFHAIFHLLLHLGHLLYWKAICNI